MIQDFFSLNTETNTGKFWDDIVNEKPEYIFLSGGLLDKTFEELSARIKKMIAYNCHFEFVILNPKSPATKLFLDNVYAEDDFDLYHKKLKENIEVLKKYKNKYGDKIIVRLNDNVPSFKIIAMFSKSPENEEISPKTIKAIFYSEKIEHDDWLCYTIKNFDISNTGQIKYEQYKYFCDQISAIRTRLKDEIYEADDLEKIIKNWNICFQINTLMEKLKKCNSNGIKTAIICLENDKNDKIMEIIERLPKLSKSELEKIKECLMLPN